MVSTKWSPTFGLPPWSTLHFKQPHTKNSNGFKTRDHAVIATGTPLPICPSWCKILHVCVSVTPAILEILCIFVFGLCCTVARTSSPHCCCSHSACIHLWEGTHLPQSTVQVLKCFVIWNSVKWMLLAVFHHCCPTISMQKSYTKCMSAYSFVSILNKYFMSYFLQCEQPQSKWIAK